MNRIVTSLTLLLCIISFTKIKAQNGIINTIAGNGTAAYFGDGGLANAAEINYVYGICVDDSSNIYLDDWNNHRVRKIVNKTGIIETIGGDGNANYSGDSGLATAAEIHSPYGLAIDKGGNLYINDEVDNRIRKITKSTGIITTIAGNGTPAYSGDGGQASAAQINNPRDGIVFDTAGNLYFGDFGNNCVRKINMTTGIITTVAGKYSLGAGYSGDGGQATLAQLNGPCGIRFDKADNMYIADQGNNVIRKVNLSTGIITTVAGKYSLGAGYSGDGGQATSAQLNDVGNLLIEPDGNLLITDCNNNVVREVNLASGIITTVIGTGTYAFAGDGGLAKNAELEHVNVLCYQTDGSLIVGDDENFRIRQIKSGAGINGINTNVSDIALYPNPASDGVTLVSSKELQAGTLIYVFDIIGNQVLNKSLVNSASTETINLSGLTAGTYFIRIAAPDNSYEVKKLVIIK